MANANSVKAFKTTGFKDKETNKLQQNVENALEPIINSNIIDGVLLKNVCLSAGIANQVRHRLDREPLGWIVVRKREDSRIWDIQDFNINQKKFLTLTCSHDSNIDLWIF